MKTLSWISLIALLLFAVSCSNRPTAPAGETSAKPNAPNAPSAPAAEENRDAALLIITGKILKKDRMPAPNVELWIGSAVRNGSKLAGVKPEFYKGMLVFPGATTGADGRFEIRWNRDFFVPGREYAMVIKESAGPRAGFLNATFKVESGAGKIDLGEVHSNL